MGEGSEGTTAVAVGQVQEARTVGIKVCGGAVAQERRTRRVRETGSADVCVARTRVCTHVRDVDVGGGAVVVGVDRCGETPGVALSTDHFALQPNATQFTTITIITTVIRDAEAVSICDRSGRHRVYGFTKLGSCNVVSKNIMYGIVIY